MDFSWVLYLWSDLHALHLRMRRHSTIRTTRGGDDLAMLAKLGEAPLPEEISGT
jgi:hypothetical protein